MPAVELLFRRTTIYCQRQPTTKPKRLLVETGHFNFDEGDTTMRFMVIVKASKDSKAGVMLAGEGLQASSKGARVKFSGEKRIVTDGPFAETKELIAGFWIWKCKSKEEAIEWVKRCPNPMPGQEAEIEIRQVFEAEDFEKP